jgi:hypothetical protein
MDRLEICCLCKVTEWWNDQELTIWHVNSERLPVHLDCWIKGYFAGHDAARSFERRLSDRSKGASGGDGHRAQDLAEVILAKIRSGGLPLPHDGSDKSYAGKGTDKPCDGCDERITQEDVEYEIDIADGRTLRFIISVSPPGKRRFHHKYFTAWQEARARTRHADV